MSNSNQSVANKKANNGKRSIEVTTAYQGPLPSPEILQGFDNVLPGAAERILKMAENEQLNRHKCDNKIVNIHVVATFLGMLFAITSVALIGYLVYQCIIHGLERAAYTIGVGSMAAVAGVFIWFRKAGKKDK